MYIESSNYWYYSLRSKINRFKSKLKVESLVHTAFFMNDLENESAHGKMSISCIIYGVFFVRTSSMISRISNSKYGNEAKILPHYCHTPKNQ